MPRETRSSSAAAASLAQKCLLTEADLKKLLSTPTFSRYSEYEPIEFLGTYLTPDNFSSLISSSSSTTTTTSSPSSLFSNAMRGLKVDEIKEILRFIINEKNKHYRLTGKKDELIRRCTEALFPSLLSSSSSSSSQSSSSSSSQSKTTSSSSSSSSTSSKTSTPASSSSSSSLRTSSLSSSLNVQRQKTAIEISIQTKIENLLRQSPTIKGLIDPLYPIEQLLELKHVTSNGNSYTGGYQRVGFAFELSRHNLEKLTMRKSGETVLENGAIVDWSTLKFPFFAHELSVHMLEVVTVPSERTIDSLELKTQNWSEQISLRITDSMGATGLGANSPLQKPKGIKLLQKNKKGKSKSNVVVATPSHVQLVHHRSMMTTQVPSHQVPSQFHELNYVLTSSSSLSSSSSSSLSSSHLSHEAMWNRLELQIPYTSSVNSIVLVTISKRRTVRELIDDVKKRYQDSKNHQLDLNNNSTANTASTVNHNGVMNNFLSTLLPSVTNSTNTTTSSEMNKKDEEDEDDLLACDEEIVPVKDPLTMSRIEIPAKGLYCVHRRCFDLETYIEYCAKSRLWQCPCCSRRLPCEEVIIDDYMTKVFEKLSQNEVLYANIEKIRVNNKTNEWEIVDVNSKTTTTTTTNTVSMTTTTTTTMTSCAHKADTSTTAISPQPHNAPSSSSTAMEIVDLDDEDDNDGGMIDEDSDGGGMVQCVTSNASSKTATTTTSGTALSDLGIPSLSSSPSLIQFKGDHDLNSTSLSTSASSSPTTILHNTLLNDIMGSLSNINDKLKNLSSGSSPFSTSNNNNNSTTTTPSRFFIGNLNDIAGGNSSLISKPATRVDLNTSDTSTNNHGLTIDEAIEID